MCTYTVITYIYILYIYYIYIHWTYNLGIFRDLNPLKPYHPPASFCQLLHADLGKWRLLKVEDECVLSNNINDSKILQATGTISSAHHANYQAKSHQNISGGESGHFAKHHMVAAEVKKSWWILPPRHVRPRRWSTWTGPPRGLCPLGWWRFIYIYIHIPPMDILYEYVCILYYIILCICIYIYYISGNNHPLTICHICIHIMRYSDITQPPLPGLSKSTWNPPTKR